MQTPSGETESDFQSKAMDGDSAICACSMLVLCTKKGKASSHQTAVDLIRCTMHDASGDNGACLGNNRHLCVGDRNSTRTCDELLERLKCKSLCCTTLVRCAHLTLWSIEKIEF